MSVTVKKFKKKSFVHRVKFAYAIEGVISKYG
jgi:hypothetical protein